MNKKKRLQVVLSEDAWTAVENLTKEATDNFEVGTINYSDVINEMVLSSKVDIKALQLKHTDLRRSLRAMASKENLDVDTIIKCLSELKLKTSKKSVKAQTSIEDFINE